jgi:uncharacterized membrane protein
MLAKKGNSRHKKIGKLYFYAMLTASVAAIPMSCLHPNYFLFLISIFTIYMLLTGVRYVHKKGTSQADTMDWLLTIMMLLFAIAFIGFGAFHMVKGNYFGIVFIVFGGFGLSFSYQDYINFTGQSKVVNYYLTTHLQRLTGSYIASTTAFLVVNNKVLPSIAAWLLPTILIVPLIVNWTNKHKVEKIKTNL